ncbi:MAG TPA: hypothetical protein VFW64_00980 [Pseudonocardiaceae bacterium]|nr:hypothetical protein [Pseudonocardiaceae bacterium]
MSRPPQTVAAWSTGAQLFDGLGDFHRTVTTSSPDAQRYFDQGMRYLWAFNHDESTRSFAKAAQLDPVPFMAQPRVMAAWEAVQLAQKAEQRTTPVERALVDAVSKRYNGAQPLDPTNEGLVLNAYAETMKNVAQQFPGDLDVQTMYAEAMMNLKP